MLLSNPPVERPARTPASGRVRALRGAALTPERLHARYSKKIDRHIRAVLGSDPEREDIGHDVLMTVFRKIGSLRNPECLDRWVNQITHNTLKHVMRQRGLRRHASVEELGEQQLPSQQLDFEARELAHRAIAIMKRLPRSDCALLTNYWLGANTARSLAAETGCSLVTMRRRLFKARARFEKLARKDAALALCLDEARSSSRRWRHFRAASADPSVDFFDFVDPPSTVHPRTLAAAE